VKTAFDKADRVSLTIGRRLGYPSWYLGTAIDRSVRDGYVLTVRVERGHAPALPDRIDGVRVRVVEDEMARPLPSTIEPASARRALR
jgi:hypothetical protein